MKSIARFVSSAVILAAFCLFAGCKSPGGGTVQEKRDSVLEMRTNALAELHRLNPDIEGHLKSAPGYAVFSNFGLKILVAGGDNGYGIVHNNKTGVDTYMRMGQVNVGLGFSVKNFREVFVFNTERVMNEFVDKGWDIGGNAEAGGKVDNKGAELGKAVSIGDTDIYQFTKDGLALQATVGATKYWKDKDLNAAQ